MRFSKIVVSILIANMIIYAWVWSIIYALTLIEPPGDLTMYLYTITGGELALTFAASAVGDKRDLEKETISKKEMVEKKYG